MPRTAHDQPATGPVQLARVVAVLLTIALIAAVAVDTGLVLTIGGAAVIAMLTLLIGRRQHPRALR
jgi:hypothetical protein